MATVVNYNNQKYHIAGNNIYVDRKGRHILFVKSSNTGYVVPQNAAGQYQLYHNRLAIAIAIFMLLASLLGQWQFPLGIGFIFFGLMEFRYRKWLKTLTRIENYKPDQKKSTIDALVETGDKKRCLILSISYLLLGVLLVINGYQTGSSTMVLTFEYICLAFCIYMSAQKFIAISRMK